MTGKPKRAKSQKVLKYGIKFDLNLNSIYYCQIILNNNKAMNTKEMISSFESEPNQSWLNELAGWDAICRHNENLYCITFHEGKHKCSLNGDCNKFYNTAESFAKRILKLANTGQ